MAAQIRLRFRGLPFLLLVIGLILLVPAVPALAGPGDAQALQALDPAAGITSVGRIEIPVADLDRSIEFFTKVLNFQVNSEHEGQGEDLERLEGLFGVRTRAADLQLGDESIRLTQYLVPRGRPMPADSRAQDHWFQHIAIIVSDMDAAYRRLREFKVAHASTAPQLLPAWNKSAGGIRAFYFRDPDDHFLEILWFPPGKGLEKWHRAAPLFLGIDHTAIVSSDTAASLAFYQDTLGMKVAGESENYGIEQEHLNNVFGARLRITALRAARGPGIELLEYLAPRDGRPYPADSRASDLWSWQTHLLTTKAEKMARSISRHYEWISPGVVSLARREIGFTKGIQVRDPDGHVMLLEQR
jgi:catechol 2,3-dioxygenase-like lactoylglutathione lyase family enzyme